MESILKRLARITVSLLLLLVILRIWMAMNAFLSPPGTVTTSGCEEASWQNMVNIIQGGPIFVNEFDSPFSATYFNWLFYLLYSIGCAPFVLLVDPAWIIPVGRLVTLSFGLLGVWLLYRAFKQSALGQRDGWLVLCFSCVPFFGILNGWWVFTVRPDTGALAFEAGSVAVLLLAAHRPWLQVWGAAFFLYAAWAMKPSYVAGVPVAVLFVLIRVGWRHALVLTGVMVLAWGLSFWLGGEMFRKAMVGVGTGNVFSYAVFYKNLSEALIRGSGIWIPMVLAGLSLFLSKNKSIMMRSEVLLGSLGIVFTFCVYAIPSAKEGADFNYWMPTSLYAVCFMVGMASVDEVAKRVRLWEKTFLVTHIALAILFFFRLGGVDSLKPDMESLARKWECYQELPEPRFASHSVLNLSWLNPESPPYVLSFDYGKNRGAGLEFENDGIGGAIRAGQIQSLLLSQPTSAFDGAKLKPSYQLQHSEPGIAIYNYSRSSY